MYFKINILAACLAFVAANAQNTTVPDQCSKTEYACLDVINSSLCLSEAAAQVTNTTKATMASCVYFPGGASNLTGAEKLCRCPGCHSKSIDAVISKLFPPPCSQYASPASTSKKI